MSVTSAQAISLLENVLFESATAAKANAAGWVALSNLNSSYSTIAGLASAMAGNAEASIASQVVRYYEGALGRAPGGTEIAYYVNIAETGLTASQISQGASAVSQAVWNQIASDFANSPEFAFASASASSVVTLLYLNILGRSPTATEVAFYNAQLASGLGNSILVQEFTNSPEYQGKVDANIASALSSYGSSVATGTTPVTINPIVTTPTGTSTALTTGVDTINLTGNNNAVNGTADGTGATFTVGDQIIGAAGSTGNSLNLSDLGTVATTTSGLWTPLTLAGVTISNIQALNLTSAEAVTVDASSLSGLTSFSAITVSGAGAGNTNIDTVTVSDTTSVKVTDTVAANIGAGVGLTVNGGTTVTVIENNSTFTSAGTGIAINGGDATTTVSVTQTRASTGADQTVTITDLNTTAGGGTASANGIITTVTIDGLDGAHNVTIKDNSLGTLTVNDVDTAGSTVLISQEATAATPTTTLSLVVNNDKSFILQDNLGDYTTLNITTGSSASAVELDTAAVKTLTVAGASKLTLTAGSTLTALATVSVTGAAGLSDGGQFASLANLTSVVDSSSGSVSVALADQVTSFDGSKGTGKETVTITTDATKTITGGTSTSNEVIFNAASTAFTASKTGANVTGFTVFGTGASSTGSYDLSTAPFSGYKAIDVSADSAGALTFANVTAGSALSIDATTTGAHTITYNTSDSSGASDSATVNVGTSSLTAGVTVVGLVLEDKTSAAVGSVTVASTLKNATYTNTIDSLDSGVSGGISSLTITGNAGLNIGTAIGAGTDWVDGASALTITNNAAGTGTSAFFVADNSLATLNLAGTYTAATTFTLSDTLLGGVTVNDTAAGNVTFTASALTNATSLTVNDSSVKGTLLISDVTDSNLTSLTLNNTGGATLTDGTVTGVQGTSLATINMTGTGKEALFLTNLYTGTLTLADSDTAAVTLSLSDAASANLLVSDSGGAFTILTGATSSAALISLSNTSTGTSALTVTSLTDNVAGTVNLTGLVSLTLTDSKTGAISISGASDNAANTISLTHDNATGTASSGSAVITLGNGANQITVNDSLNTSNTDSITVGSGADTITLTGTHASATVTFSAANGASTSTFTFISGLATGDTVAFATAAINGGINAEGTVSSIAAGIAGAITTDGYNTFVVGTNTYVYENTGTAATSELVELVGTTHGVASATTAHIVIS